MLLRGGLIPGRLLLRGWLDPGRLVERSGLAVVAQIRSGERLLTRGKVAELLRRLHTQTVEKLNLSQALAGEHGAIELGVLH